MHRDIKERTGSRRGNIQHLRERNGRDSLWGPQPPEEWGTKGSFRRVQENCWSGGLKLVCPPPKKTAVSSTSRPWLLFSRCTSDRPSHLSSTGNQGSAQGTRAASLQIFISALTQGGEGWNCREMNSAQMKCWGMEVSMQNLAPSQMSCEEERGLPQHTQQNKKHLLLLAFVLPSGTPMMFSPTSLHPLKPRQVSVL